MSESAPITMSLSKLHAHPLQSRYYGDSPAAENAALAADLRANGQRDPIIVLPKGNAAGLPANTILDGHRRATMLAEIGTKTALVTIRHDLKDADEATVEAEFLRFNFLRRQLKPLDQATIALRLFEIEKEMRRGGIHGSWQAGKARDEIGKLIGWSGRHLLRMFRILALPPEIQKAVRDEFLPVILAEKISSRPRDTQRLIAERFADAENRSDIRAIVEEYIPSGSGRHKRTGDAAATFFKNLKIGLDDLDGRIEYVSARLANDHLDILNQAAGVIGTLITRAAGAPQAEAEFMGALEETGSLSDTMSA